MSHLNTFALVAAPILLFLWRPSAAESFHGWVMDHWAAGEFRPCQVSTLAIVYVLAAIVASAAIGEAYAADSASDIVDVSLYVENLSGFEGAGDALVRLLIVVPVLAVADVIGRFWYRWLLWVPPAVPSGVIQLSLAAFLYWVVGGASRSFQSLIEAVRGGGSAEVEQR